MISSDTHVIMYDAIKAGKHYVNTQKPPPEREQTSTHMIYRMCKRLVVWKHMGGKQTEKLFYFP